MTSGTLNSQKSPQTFIHPGMLQTRSDLEPYDPRARGNRLEYWINGTKVMDYLDHDPKASRRGLIGFQIHDGSVMKVAYRNIRVLPL